MEKSKGHIAFLARPMGLYDTAVVYELFLRTGDIYRAPISDVVMPDGYRTGRWECTESHYDRYRHVILSSWSVL